MRTTDREIRCQRHRTLPWLPKLTLLQVSIRSLKPLTLKERLASCSNPLPLRKLKACEVHLRHSAPQVESLSSLNRPVTLPTHGLLSRLVIRLAVQALVVRPQQYGRQLRGSCQSPTRPQRHRQKGHKCRSVIEPQKAKMYYDKQQCHRRQFSTSAHDRQASAPQTRGYPPEPSTQHHLTPLTL